MDDGHRHGHVQGGASALPGSDVYGQLPGRGSAPQYDVETMEAVLWEVALQGGNAAKAVERLRAEWEDHGRDPDLLPTANTIRRWLRGRYRNRYHEITQARARDLEENLAARQTARALAMDDVQADLLQRVQAGIHDLDAEKAAAALRNVAQAQKLNQDGAQITRRSKRADEDSRTLSTMAEALKRLGVAEVIDGTAEEMGERELPSPPAP